MIVGYTVNFVNLKDVDSKQCQLRQLGLES